MSHTEDFAAFRARRDAERARMPRVTWRRVSADTGGGYSGLGPAGALVYAVGRGLSGSRRVFDYGAVLNGKRVRRGSQDTLAAAKLCAASLLAPVHAPDCDLDDDCTCEAGE